MARQANSGRGHDCDRDHDGRVRHAGDGYLGVGAGADGAAKAQLGDAGALAWACAARQGLSRRYWRGGASGRRAEARLGPALRGGGALWRGVRAARGAGLGGGPDVSAALGVFAADDFGGVVPASAGDGAGLGGVSHSVTLEGAGDGVGGAYGVCGGDVGWGFGVGLAQV